MHSLCNAPTEIHNLKELRPTISFGLLVVTGQNGSRQNGMDKMVYGQNVIGQNSMDKMVRTKW